MVFSAFLQLQFATRRNKAYFIDEYWSCFDFNREVVSNKRKRPMKIWWYITDKTSEEPPVFIFFYSTVGIMHLPCALFDFKNQTFSKFNRIEPSLPVLFCFFFLRLWFTHCPSQWWCTQRDCTVLFQNLQSSAAQSFSTIPSDSVVRLKKRESWKISGLVRLQSWLAHFSFFSFVCWTFSHCRRYTFIEISTAVSQRVTLRKNQN